MSRASRNRAARYAADDRRFAQIMRQRAIAEGMAARERAAAEPLPPEQRELVTLRMTAATRATLLAALDEAAMGKEDRARECGCEGCEDCEFRRQAAKEYRQLAEIVGEAGDVPVPEADAEQQAGDWRAAQGAADREAGQ